MILLFLQLAMPLLFPPAAPDPWLGIAGAPSGAVAVWRGGRVLWSAHGDTFAPILAGLADDAPVSAVALDDDGTAWVARGKRLGLRTPDGVEHWLAGPATANEAEALFARGKVVVWLGRVPDYGSPELTVSRDRGQTFEERPEWPSGNNHRSITLDAKGRIEILASWEVSCGGGDLKRVVGTVADLTLRRVEWPRDTPFYFVLTRTGWAYVKDGCGTFGLCAIPPGDGPARTLDLDVPLDLKEPYADVIAAGDDRRTWILLDGHLIVASEASARVLSSALPPEATALAVAAQRPWVLAADGPHTLTATGWRRVAVPSLRRELLPDRGLDRRE